MQLKSYSPERLFKHLLWIDCIGAAVVGMIVVVLSSWLSDLEGLPQNVLLFTGIMNLIYGSFSFTLAMRKVRPMSMIKLLVIANLVWTPVCFGLLLAFSDSATLLAWLHLGGEAIYVGLLGMLEWKFRDLLTWKR